MRHHQNPGEGGGGLLLIDETLNAVRRGAAPPHAALCAIGCPARWACALAMCCVRLSGETEAECAASSHVPDSPKCL